MLPVLMNELGSPQASISGGGSDHGLIVGVTPDVPAVLEPLDGHRYHTLHQAESVDVEPSTAPEGIPSVGYRDGLGF